MSGVRRIQLTRDDLLDMDKKELIEKWYQQEGYIDKLEDAIEILNKQSDSHQRELKSNELKYKKRLHNVCMKLTLRDRKLAQLQDKLDQVIQSQSPSQFHLESTLVDPAVNLMFEKMKCEVDASKVKVEEMQNELSAWKFTPDSTTGKRLMAKCRLLHNENEELGKEMSNGWVAQLTGNLALQKKFSEEMKKSQTELDEFLLELEEEVEGMQNTIYYLQQQLKEAKGEKTTTIQQQQQPNASRSSNSNGDDGVKAEYKISLNDATKTIDDDSQKPISPGEDGHQDNPDAVKRIKVEEST